MRALILLLVLVSAPLGAERPIDPDTGLVIDEHWELVMGMCGSCHSYKIVTAQRGDRAYWKKTIRWMQDTQNLWDIPAPIEEKILDYLARNYVAEETGRRPPLPPALMPADAAK